MNSEIPLACIGFDTDKRRFLIKAFIFPVCGIVTEYQFEY